MNKTIFVGIKLYTGNFHSSYVDSKLKFDFSDVNNASRVHTCNAIKRNPIKSICKHWFWLCESSELKMSHYNHNENSEFIFLAFNHRKLLVRSKVVQPWRNSKKNSDNLCDLIRCQPHPESLEIIKGNSNWNTRETRALAGRVGTDERPERKGFLMILNKFNEGGIRLM